MSSLQGKGCLISISLYLGLMGSIRVDFITLFYSFMRSTPSLHLAYYFIRRVVDFRQESRYAQALLTSISKHGQLAGM